MALKQKGGSHIYNYEICVGKCVPMVYVCYFSSSGNTKLMVMLYFLMAVLLSVKYTLSVDFSFNDDSLSAILRRIKDWVHPE